MFSGEVMELVCSVDVLNDCVCINGVVGVQGCVEDGIYWLFCECTMLDLFDVIGMFDVGLLEDIVSKFDVILFFFKDMGTMILLVGSNVCDVQEDCEEFGACFEDVVLGCVCMVNAQGVKWCMF